MPRIWSAADIAALADAAETLLSPLKWPSREAWMAESLRRLRAVFNADASVMYGPLVGARGVASPDLSADILNRLEAVLRCAEGVVHSLDPVFDDAYAGHRRSRSRILTMRDLRAYLGPRLEESSTWQTVVAPSRLFGSASIGALTGGYDTVLSLMSSREEGMELDEAGHAAMRIARAAFVAGLDTYVHLEAWRNRLGTMLDRVGTGIALFTHDGCRELARNTQLDLLLRREPERRRLLDMIRRIARLAGRPLDDPWGEVSGVHQRDRHFTLEGGSYRLLSSGVAGGALAHDPTVLILVDRSGPELPAPGLLVERFGLTPREAEIGLLLAEGLSNQAIATRLGLSAHTVRHHVERLFDKLDVRSRKALALFFLRGAPAAARPLRNPRS